MSKIPPNLDITTATREELYAYRRSPEWQDFLRSDMILRGFYIPKTNNNAKDLTLRLAVVQKELQEINLELDEMRNEHKGILNQSAAIARAQEKQKTAHRERLKESLERRAARKAERIQARKARKAAWQVKKSTTLIHIGDFDSAALHDRSCDEDKLRSNQLPILKSDLDVLEFLKSEDRIPLTLKRLRHLCTRHRLSRFHLYHRFEIPKKTGGHRQISAPIPILRQIQRRILDGLLNQVSLHEAAHGFAPSRSIVSNAKPHTQQAIVINMDLKDFFPSIHFPRVRGMFMGLGYSKSVATILSVLCTEPNVRSFTLDNERWYQQEGSPTLPQGSPASPAITNIICRRLDARLKGLAESLGYTYTRYADDLTFSTNKSTAPIQSIIAASNVICADEGFQVHPDKTRIMRSGARQEVTGIVVNDHLNVSRKRLRCFRAYLHHVATKGISKAEWEGTRGKESIPKAIGFAAFVHAVREKDGQVLHDCLKILAPFR